MARSYAPAVHTRAHFARQAQADWHGTDTVRVPPQWLLDAAAEATINQGWRTGRGNICGGCHLARTVTGVCGC